MDSRVKRNSTKKMGEDGRMKLTPTQKRILQNLASGRPWDNGCSGMAQHGGWTRSRFSLHTEDLVYWDKQTNQAQLSENGKAVVKDL